MSVILRAFNGPTDWAWVLERLPMKCAEDTGGIVAIDADSGDILGACITESWTPSSVQVSFVIESPMVLRHGFIEAVCEYVYTQCGRKVIFVLVPSNNKKSDKITAKIGFTEVARLHDAVEIGVDYIIKEMRAEDCRWLADKEAA